MDRDKLIEQTDFIVSWHAKKYNKFIWRIGNMSKEGCRVGKVTAKNICVSGTQY